MPGKRRVVTIQAPMWRHQHVFVLHRQALQVGTIGKVEALDDVADLGQGDLDRVPIDTIAYGSCQFAWIALIDASVAGDEELFGVSISNPEFCTLSR